MFVVKICIITVDMRHELTLHVEQLPLMKLLKWNRNSVGRFHTVDAGSRKFEHKYLPIDTAQIGFDKRPLDKTAFRFFLRVVCFPSSVSLDQRSVHIYSCI